MSNTESGDTPRVPDDTLLRKARNAENGEQFAKRFDNGYDSPELNDHYESRVAAAKALLFNICWWTVGDRAQSKRLFKRSVLGQEFAECGWLDTKLPELLDDVITELAGRGYLVTDDDEEFTS